MSGVVKMPMPFWNWATYPGHQGIDWGQRLGTPIGAIAPGTVTYLGEWGREMWWNGQIVRGGGITRTITRPNGLQIIHCHLNSYKGPRVGERVELGDFIGEVGNTGWSTGPHLHIEMWKDGIAQDEWYWMDQDNWLGKNGTPASDGGDSTPFTPITKAVLEEDEMTIIAQRTNSALAKGLYNPATGRIREITKSENELLRNAEKAAVAQGQPRLASGVLYSTVSNEAYSKLVSGKK